jgi:hypothetical protein
MVPIETGAGLFKGAQVWQFAIPTENRVRSAHRSVRTFIIYFPPRYFSFTVFVEREWMELPLCNTEVAEITFRVLNLGPTDYIVTAANPICLSLKFDN